MTKYYVNFVGGQFVVEANWRACNSFAVCRTQADAEKQADILNKQRAAAIEEEKNG